MDGRLRNAGISRSSDYAVSYVTGLQSERFGQSQTGEGGGGRTGVHVAVGITFQARLAKGDFGSHLDVSYLRHFLAS